MRDAATARRSHGEQGGRAAGRADCGHHRRCGRPGPRGRASVRPGGARAALLDIQVEAGRQTAGEIAAAGGTAMFLAADVSRGPAVHAALARVIAEWGRIDTLFNHAGTIIVKPFHETTDEDYDRLMDINVRLAFLTCRAVVSRMCEKGGGSIVITSSIGGEKGFALEGLYCRT
jgi:NAD(P)-dependent dehydrogenase (short-subunit alcohol dehydrogenase family)